MTYVKFYRVKENSKGEAIIQETWVDIFEVVCFGEHDHGNYIQIKGGYSITVKESIAEILKKLEDAHP